MSQRIVFTMGGKGGVGKTMVMCSVVDWFHARGHACRLFDLDVENNGLGSLKAFFPEAVKRNIFTPESLDALLDESHGTAKGTLLADMGSSSGAVTYGWFNAMHTVARESGLRFTAIGVVTEDPASVESVLTWMAKLQGRVDFLIVENHTTMEESLAYWERSPAARKLVAKLKPKRVSFSHRVDVLERACRKYRVSLAKVAARKVPHVAELAKTSMVIRADQEVKRINSQLDGCRQLLL